MSSFIGFPLAPANTGLSSVIYSQVQVRFRSRRCTGKASDFVPDYWIETINFDDTLGDLPSGLVGKGVLVTKDDALALFNAGGATPTNQTVLHNLSVQLATDILSWRSVSHDITFNGIIASPPNGIMDTCEWNMTTGEITTRQITEPLNFNIEEFQHNDGTDNLLCVDVAGQLATSKTPCIETYVPKSTIDNTGVISAHRARICLEDGRLLTYYSSTDSLQCGCSAPAPSTICITVNACDGGPQVGANVHVTGPGGFSADCTTVLSGPHALCCVGVTATGVYTATSGGGSTTVTVTGAGNFAGTICYTPGMGGLCIRVLDQCGGPAVGLPVTASGGGSGTTDINGTVCICTSVGSGTLTSMPPTGYNAISKPYTVASECSGQPLLGTTETLASGFGEVCCGCGPTSGPGGIGGTDDLPVPNPLTITDPVFGNTNLTWNAVSGLWEGTSVAKGWSCIVGGFPCTMASSSATYKFGRTGSIADPCRLTVSWNTTALSPCFGSVSGSMVMATTTSSCPPSFITSGTSSCNGTFCPYCGLVSVTFVIFQ